MTQGAPAVVLRDMGQVIQPGSEFRPRGGSFFGETMALVDSWSDEQIDELLERFDQTEPKLQRRIIVEFMVQTQRMKRALENAQEVLRLYREEHGDHDYRLVTMNGILIRALEIAENPS